MITLLSWVNWFLKDNQLRSSWEKASCSNAYFEPLFYLVTREELRKTTLPEVAAGKICPDCGLITSERFRCETRRALVGGHDMPVTVEGQLFNQRLHRLISVMLESDGIDE